MTFGFDSAGGDLMLLSGRLRSPQSPPEALVLPFQLPEVLVQLILNSLLQTFQVVGVYLEVHSSS